MQSARYKLSRSKDFTASSSLLSLNTINSLTSKSKDKRRLRLRRKRLRKRLKRKESRPRKTPLKSRKSKQRPLSRLRSSSSRRLSELPLRKRLGSPKS